MKIICATIIAVLELNYLVHSKGLNEEFTWTKISYVENYQGDKPLPPYSGDNPALKSLGLDDYDQKNDYILENNIPMGVNRWNDKLFITIPRRRLGVPSTLNYISVESSQKHDAPLIPYPDWKTNAMIAQPDLEHLISVYRIAIDPCDRLWLVDTGVIELPENRTILGPQRIVIIDLNTDKIIKTYNFKQSDLGFGTTLSQVNVDVTADTCDDAYAYFPDLNSYALIVYSLKQNDSWRLRHNYFYMEPQSGEFNIGGIQFQWQDGIFSGALTEKQADGYRAYIFHSMAGTNLYAVSTRILKSKELSTRFHHGNDFMLFGDRGPNTQTSASDLHERSGVLFLCLVNMNALGCWNTKTRSFDPNNFGIVYRNDSAMIYPSDVRIYKNDVILLSTTMPVFLYSNLNYDVINFRVWMRNVQDAISGTVCKASKRETRY